MGLFDRLRGNGDERVVFLGIDGVPYSLIDDHPDVFSNLHAIADAGTATAIDSIVPPESSACWPSLTTGTNPGQTGVYGFQDRERDSYETYIPLGSHVRGDRLWEHVTDAGREATVCNVPVTFPPDTASKTRLVSGFLSPDLEAACPDPSLRRTLAQLDYRIDVDASLGHDEDKTDFIEDAYATLEARKQAFARLLEGDGWDLFFGVFMTTDRINHFLFGDHERDGEYADEFLAFYRTLDEYIGDIHDRLDEDTHLVIASDHGFTTLDHEVNANAYLEQQGWLSFASDDHDELADIDPESEAYSLIPGRFYLNLEGREPDGAVSADAYETKLAALIEDLEALTGPDGRPVADRIVRGDAVFDGDNTDIAPDLVVIPNDGFDLKAGFGDKDAVFSEGPRNGMHTFEDACLFATADLATDGVDLFDLAPTLLDLLEVDYQASTFDGRSLVTAA